MQGYARLNMGANSLSSGPLGLLAVVASVALVAACSDLARFNTRSSGGHRGLVGGHAEHGAGEPFRRLVLCKSLAGTRSRFPRRMSMPLPATPAVASSWLPLTTACMSTTG